MEAARIEKLESIEKLSELVKSSSEKPVVLFKHSTACSISRGVLEIVKRVDSSIHMIVVQESRDVSNAVEDLTGIRHESPQAFVFKDGKCVYHASHYDISETEIHKHL